MREEGTGDEMTAEDEIALYIGQRIKIDENGCHVWQGALSRGYGAMRVDGKWRRAHRVAWELANGSIPDGLFVMHKCDNPPCVNLDHLTLGTPADNVRDKVEKGRSVRRDGIGYSMPEIAELAHVEPSTVTRWIHSGRLAAVSTERGFLVMPDVLFAFLTTWRKGKMTHFKGRELG